VSILSVEGLSAGYGAVPVLHDVTLSMEPGECVAVLGPNGAGKSTLAKVLGGSLAPMSGTVRLDGEIISGLPPHILARKGIFHLPESQGVFPHLTVAENVQLGVARAGTRRDRIAAEERVYVAFPELAQRRRQVARTLSGGERRILALSHVLVVPPRVLVADEVSLGLAPIVIDRMYGLLGQIIGAGVAVVLIEQFVSRALSCAQEAIALQLGRVVWSGPCQEMTEDLYFAKVSSE
jgi:branched-chain amino acid transport system ATP-binding protein